MSANHFVSRRLVIGGGIALAAGLAGTARGQQNPLSATSAQDLGPFFPVIRPLDQDADLTRIAGAGGTARGTIINVVGRVLDRNGRPVPRARLDLWQCNAVGRYSHPGDARDDVPLDPNFQGSAILTADDDGTFRFRTIKPGAYPIPSGVQRPPHIHFDVTGRSERLTTQMYFPGEALNEADFLFRAANPRESVVARAIDPLTDDPANPAFNWDVVLAVG